MSTHAQQVLKGVVDSSEWEWYLKHKDFVCANFHLRRAKGEKVA